MFYTMVHSHLRDNNGNTIATMTRCDGGHMIEIQSCIITTHEVGRQWSASLGGTIYATACPSYANGEDPSISGWPVNRLPRTDKACVQMDGRVYTLSIERDSCFRLYDGSRTVMEVRHRGLVGGWTIASSLSLEETVIAYVFCRALERENDFPI